MADVGHGSAPRGPSSPFSQGSGIPIPKSPHNRTKEPRESKAELDRKCLARFAELTADEPPVPADGTCVVCGEPRQPERSRKYAHGCAEIDPFCSSECARAFHENPYPEHGNTGLSRGDPSYATHVPRYSREADNARKRLARLRARQEREKEAAA